ncbi:uncharacterized protein HD556DRAFT_1280723 [Suillus plorans]|uniref:Uncharacterized protein n=1 Tax=Suillus plorans TaxID=116603 RepID=A0A9P7E3M3_9AGAM|nr:uncharacterized protein HD556DRAFT_1280723 [Suillus plorans]KAG1809925.1 hypothetical protein HD556DRAFT_1280723 [Suillus plorans]
MITLASQSNVSIPLPPPGTNYLATLKLSIPWLLTGTVLSSLLIPILIALLVFSTPQTRRHPIFMFNMLGVLLGLAEGALNIYLEVHTILSPTVAESKAAVIAYTAVAFFGPLVAEITLVIRLTVVYPRRTTPKVKFWSLLLVPITLKVIRAINMSIFLHYYVVAVTSAGDSIAAGESLWGDWQTKFEWILQAVDNAFVSFMFLHRLTRNTSASEGVIRPRAIAKRLQGLFVIALCNFVFPVVLNIIQLGLIFSSTTSFFQTSMVYMVNNYVNIIGVVFATIWSIGSRKLESSLPPITSRSLSTSDSTINPGRMRIDSHNFKSVNLVESIELQGQKHRTPADKGAPQAASQGKDGYV